jgi:hypothetical protein
VRMRRPGYGHRRLVWWPGLERVSVNHSSSIEPIFQQLASWREPSRGVPAQAEAGVALEASADGGSAESSIKMPLG